jgi:hypothetical protein
MRQSSRTGFACLLAVLALGGFAPSAGAQILPPSGKVLWGAWIGGNAFGLAGDAPWDTVAWNSFEQDTGKRVSLLAIAQPWKQGGAFQTFPTTSMQSIVDRGAYPVMTWSSWELGVGKDQPAFQLADITAGKYDSYIRAWAIAARDWGRPFFLRFDREMNLSCCWPWAEAINGNKPGDFVAAWRHVYRIFHHDVGATNVAWVWCPNASLESRYAALYPGKAFVNWMCTDGYNWGSARPAGWRSFRQVFQPSYSALKAISTKPIMLGEVASVEAGGSKADWIDRMFYVLPRLFPQIRGFVWTNRYLNSRAWPIESSLSAQRAFGAQIARPRYLAP